MLPPVLLGTSAVGAETVWQVGPALRGPLHVLWAPGAPRGRPQGRGQGAGQGGRASGLMIRRGCWGALEIPHEGPVAVLARGWGRWRGAAGSQAGLQVSGRSHRWGPGWGAQRWAASALPLWGPKAQSVEAPGQAPADGTCWQRTSRGLVLRSGHAGQGHPRDFLRRWCEPCSPGSCAGPWPPRWRMSCHSTDGSSDEALLGAVLS